MNECPKCGDAVPPKWVVLKDVEIWSLWEKHKKSVLETKSITPFARAIEQALLEKN